MSEQKQHEKQGHTPPGGKGADGEMAQVVPPSKEALDEEKKRKEQAEQTALPELGPYTGAAPATPAVRIKAAELKKFQAEQAIKEAEQEIEDAEKAQKEQEQKEKEKAKD
jgi:O-acetyl-ADP-ribose deacetylase (regulator of RNase III)